VSDGDDAEGRMVCGKPQRLADGVVVERTDVHRAEPERVRLQHQVLGGGAHLDVDVALGAVAVLDRGPLIDARDHDGDGRLGDVLLPERGLRQVLGIRLGGPHSDEGVLSGDVAVEAAVETVDRRRQHINLERKKRPRRGRRPQAAPPLPPLGIPGRRRFRGRLGDALGRPQELGHGRERNGLAVVRPDRAARGDGLDERRAALGRWRGQADHRSLFHALGGLLRLAGLGERAWLPVSRGLLPRPSGHPQRQYERSSEHNDKNAPEKARLHGCPPGYDGGSLRPTP